jgi:hypothetical protein
VGKFSACRLLVIATILAVSLVAFPADRAMAYDDGSVPANVGSLDDYVRQGQPRDRGYAPRGSYGGQGRRARLLWRSGRTSLADEPGRHGCDDVGVMGSPAT